MHNIVAPRYKLATVNKTRDICPERFPNITLTSSLQRDSTTRTKTKKTTKILPRKTIIGPEKTKLNAIRGLGKRAKKLDGEGPTVTNSSQPRAFLMESNSRFIPVFFMRAESKSLVWAKTRSFRRA